MGLEVLTLRKEDREQHLPAAPNDAREFSEILRRFSRQHLCEVRGDEGMIEGCRRVREGKGLDPDVRLRPVRRGVSAREIEVVERESRVGNRRATVGDHPGMPVEAGVRANRFANQMRRSVATRSIGRGLTNVEPEAGTLVVYAAKHGQVALDGDGGNSPFVTALTKRMNTPGLEVRRLFDHVRDDVLEMTNRAQQPFSYGSLPGSEDYYFRAAATAKRP